MVRMIPLLDVNWQGLPLSSSLGYRDSDVVSFLEKEELDRVHVRWIKAQTGFAF